MTLLIENDIIDNEINNVYNYGESIINNDELIEVNQVNIENNEYDFYTIQFMNDFMDYYNYDKMMNNTHEMLSILMKHPYLLYIYLLFLDFMNNVLNKLILFKLFTEKKINEIIKFYTKNNQIEYVYLINNNNFILIPTIDRLNKEIFEELFTNYTCELDDN